MITDYDYDYGLWITLKSLKSNVIRNETVKCQGSF